MWAYLVVFHLIMMLICVCQPVSGIFRVNEGGRCQLTRSPLLYVSVTSVLCRTAWSVGEWTSPPGQTLPGHLPPGQQPPRTSTLRTNTPSLGICTVFRKLTHLDYVLQGRKVREGAHDGNFRKGRASGVKCPLTQWPVHDGAAPM